MQPQPSRVATLIGLLLIGTASADDSPPTEQAVCAQLQGSWQLIYSETDGNAKPIEDVAKVRVTIDGNTHTVQVGEATPAEKIPFAIDVANQPMTSTDTLPNGQTIRGIFRVEGDILVSCVGAADAQAPTDFSTKPDSGRTLRVFRRAGAETKEKAIADELARFEGKWEFHTLTIGGNPIPLDSLKGIVLQIEPGGRFTLTDPTATYRGIYIVDPTATLKIIDVLFIAGPEAGKISRGVYSLEGDTYTVSMGMAGDERPKILDSPAGTTHAFETLKRIP